MPMEKVISIAVSRQTSLPKLRATCSGVKNAAGAIRKKKKVQKIKNCLM